MPTTYRSKSVENLTPAPVKPSVGSRTVVSAVIETRSMKKHSEKRNQAPEEIPPYGRISEGRELRSKDDISQMPLSNSKKKSAEKKIQTKTQKKIMSNIEINDDEIEVRPEDSVSQISADSVRSSKRSSRIEEELKGVNDVMARIVRELKKPESEIKKFDGNCLDYKKFMRQFKTKIINNATDDDEIMTYLEQYTTGEAHKIVTGYSHIDARVGYPAALKELQDRYGNSEVIANAYIKRALDWPTIKADNVKLLDEYSIFLFECEAAVESINALNILEYSENLKRLVQKLPFHLHEKFRTLALDKKDKHETVKFKDLVKFVRHETRKASDPVFGKEAMHQTSNHFINNKGPRNRTPLTATAHIGRNGNTYYNQVSQNSYPSQTTCQTTYHSPAPQQNSYSSETLRQTRQHSNPNNSSRNQVDSQPPANTRFQLKPCLYCNSSLHTIEHCRQFVEKSLEDKQVLLRNLSACFGCLKQGHHVRACTCILQCSVCKGSHPTLLHNPDRQVRNPASNSSSRNHPSNNSAVLKESESPESHMGVGDEEAEEFIFSVIPVRIKVKNTDNFVITHAFLDSGSSITFCTVHVLKKLGLKGKRSKLTLNTLGSLQTLETETIRCLEIGDLHGNFMFDLPMVYSKDEIPVTNRHIPTNRDINRFSHLQGIELPEINADIGLLIGINVPNAFLPLEVMSGPDGSPHATRTRLGWVLWNIRRHVKGQTSHTSYTSQDLPRVNKVEIAAIEEIEKLTLRTAKELKGAQPG